jgi:hypothetical protein
MWLRNLNREDGGKKRTWVQKINKEINKEEKKS